MSMPAMKREIAASFDETLARLPELLKSEGFGVLTEIDVKKTFENKLGVDFKRYRILGACNPKLAHEALGHDLDVGVLLPCNVVVYEIDADHTMVSAVDPVVAIGQLGGEAFMGLAGEVKDRLSRVLDELG